MQGQDDSSKSTDVVSILIPFMPRWSTIGWPSPCATVSDWSDQRWLTKWKFPTSSWWWYVTRFYCVNTVTGGSTFGCAVLNGLSSRIWLYDDCVFLSYENVIVEESLVNINTSDQQHSRYKNSVSGERYIEKGRLTDEEREVKKTQNRDFICFLFFGCRGTAQNEFRIILQPQGIPTD